MSQSSVCNQRRPTSVTSDDETPDKGRVSRHRRACLLPYSAREAFLAPVTTAGSSARPPNSFVTAKWSPYPAHPGILPRELLAEETMGRPTRAARIGQANQRHGGLTVVATWPDRGATKAGNSDISHAGNRTAEKSSNNSDSSATLRIAGSGLCIRQSEACVRLTAATASPRPAKHKSLGAGAFLRRPSTTRLRSDWYAARTPGSLAEMRVGESMEKL